jgi:hypothetical protein
MAIRLEIHGRVSLARSFLTQTLWMVAGKTSAWPDENNPTLPSGIETSVVDPQFAKKLSQIMNVYPGTSGNYDLEVEGTYWKIATTEAIAYANSARYLYLKCLFSRLTGPSVEVRSFGIVSGLTCTPGNESSDLLLNTQILSYGKLMWLDNRKRLDRDPDNQGEIFEYVLGF